MADKRSRPARRNVIIAFVTRLTVCIVLLAAALALFVVLVSTSSTPEAGEPRAAAPGVAVMLATAVPVPRQHQSYGSVRSLDSADVPARVSATVVAVPPRIEPGVTVDAGELLVELDSSDFERQVEVSTATIAEIDAQLDRLEVEEAAWTRRRTLAAEEVELAQAEYDRVQNAVERGAAVERELDVARQALIRAIRDDVATVEARDQVPLRRAALRATQDRERAALRLARQNVERTRITSPIDGVLQAVDVEPGESVAAGTRVARVVGLDRVEVALRLPSSARRDIEIGDAVQLRPTGASPRSWRGSIDRIAPEDDAASRTMTAYVVIEGGDSPPPGQFLSGTVTTSEREPRWVVPRRAVQADRLMLVRDGVVASRPVEVDFHLEGPVPQLGLPDEQWLVLSSALAPGDQVVLDGSRLLADGMAVDPAPVNAALVAPGDLEDIARRSAGP